MSGSVKTSASHAPDSVLEGGCHCQAIRFRITVQSDQLSILDCNCSICTKKGYLHLIVPPAQFQLLKGSPAPDGSMATYTFGTHTAKHHFCTGCGITPFYRARSHPDDYDVNLRCIDDYYGVVDKVVVTPFDGKDWDKGGQLTASAAVVSVGHASSVVSYAIEMYCHACMASYDTSCT